MAFTYGFYDSVNHDRVYNADQFSSIFDGIIIDGVFKTCQIEGLTSNNDQLMVTAAGGMNVFVGRGRAWFNNTWNYNNTQIGLKLSNSHGVFNRYDAVILEINKNIDKRENSIKVITGTPASEPAKPELIKANGLYQYALAYILVPAASSTITDNDIQNVIGTNETPWCRCIADDIELKIKNDLVTTDPGYILDARQGKVLDDKVKTLQNNKIDNNKIKNNLTTNESGYVLDARQGPVLNALANGKIGTSAIKYNLTTEDTGYVLAANQGKVLNDALTTLTNLVNSKVSGPIKDNLTTQQAGQGVLDAHQGYVLNGLIDTKLNKSDVKDNLSTQTRGQALDAHQGYVLNELLENVTSVANTITSYIYDEDEDVYFRFGVDGNGNYGFKKAGADTVIPFNRYINVTRVQLTNLSIVDPVNVVVSANIKNDYPSIYKRLTKDNFYIKIDKLSFTGGYSLSHDYDPQMSDIWSNMNISPNLSFTPQIGYNQETGILTISNFSKKDTVSYNLWGGTEEVVDESFASYGQQWNISFFNNFKVYMVYKEIT